MKERSAQAANYFTSLGIRRGDRVMLVLKRHYEFWFSILALHKLGAVAIPATDQLLEKDYVYRFQAAGVSAIVTTARGMSARGTSRSSFSSPGESDRICLIRQHIKRRDFQVQEGESPERGALYRAALPLGTPSS